MMTKRKKYILGFLAILLLIFTTAGYYLYQQIYNPENLKKYFIQALSKLLKTPVTPPETIDISLLNNIVSIKNWKIQDEQGDPLLELSEATIRFQKLLFGPKIRSIEIQEPRFFLHRYSDGSFNFEIFKEQEVPASIPEKKAQEKLQDFQKTIKQLLHSEIHIAIHKAWIGILMPDLLKNQVEIQDIHVKIQNEPPEKFSLFGKKNKYNLSLDFFNEITQRILLSGTYDFEYGLHLVLNNTISFSLEDVLERFAIEQNRFQVKGNVQLSDFYFGGLSPSYPEVSINGTIRQDKGYVFLSDYFLPLSNIQSEIVFLKNQIQQIHISANFHQSLLRVVNGSVQPGGSVFLLLEIQDFMIDQNLVLPINRLLKTSVDSYWNELSPRGKIQGTGILTYEPNKGWDWSVSSRLSRGKIQYNNLKVDNIEFHCQVRKDWVQIERGSWRLNKTNFFINPNAKIYFHPLKIHEDFIISFKKFPLNRNFFSCAPELGEVWDVLQPEGFLDAKITFRGNPLKELPVVHAKCYEMKATFNEVPYPVLVSSCDLVFQGGCLSFQLQATGLDCPSRVRVKGEVWPQEKKLGVAYNARFQIKDLTLSPVVYKTFSEEKDPTSWLKDIQSIWDHIQPSGFLNIDGKVVRPRKSPDPPDFDVVIQPNNANVCYKDFPYPVTEVYGKIKARKGLVTFSNVKAKKEQGDLEISGKIIAKSQVGLDVDFCVSGNNIPLDKDLQRALGPKYKGVWEELSPQGTISLGVHVSKKAHEKEVVWQSVATLQKVSMMYAKFPYRIENLGGEIKLSPGNFSWDRVSGVARQSPIHLRGNIQENQLSLDIRAKDLVLDKDLYHALPEEGKKIARDFTFKGKISLWLRLKKERLEPLRWSGEIFFNNLQGKYRPFPYALNQVQGKVKFAEDHSVSFVCKNQDQQCLSSIEGNIKEDQLDISIKANKLDLCSRLYSSIPLEYQSLWKNFSPSGIVDLELKIQKKGKDKKQEIHIYPRHCSIKYKEFPYPIPLLMVSPLHKNSGIHIFNGSVEFHHLIGCKGKTTMELNGAFHSMEQNNARLDLQIQAENLEIDEDFRVAAAHTFPTFIKALRPEGSIPKFILNINRYEEKEKAYLKYFVEVQQLQSTMKKDHFFEKLDGNVKVSGYIYDKEYHAIGEIEKGHISIKGFQIKPFSSKIKFFHDYLLFYDIIGNFYEGELQGSLVMDVTPTGAYKGFFAVNQAHLDKISIAMKKDSDKQPTMWGSLSGEMTFQGNSYSTETMTGQGKIQLSNGVLWQFPIFLALLDIFSLPSRPAFRNGDIQFSIFQKRISITSMRFDSSLISISGKGTVDFDNNLNLSLLSHFSPSFLPSIPLVDKLWGQISHGFLSISVKGTVEKPSISMNLLQ